MVHAQSVMMAVQLVLVDQCMTANLIVVLLIIITILVICTHIAHHAAVNAEIAHLIQYAQVAMMDTTNQAIIAYLANLLAALAMYQMSVILVMMDTILMTIKNALNVQKIARNAIH